VTFQNGSFSLAVINRLLNILEEHSTGINRTNLAGKTGLNYGTCIKYVDLLLLLRWVSMSEEHGGRVQITPTGTEFMYLFRQKNKYPLADDPDENSKRGPNPKSGTLRLEESILEGHMHPDHRSFGNNGFKEGAHATSANIMIIEDERDILLAYEFMLRQQGFNVYAFSDPEMALQLFQSNRGQSIDLVICDIRMESLNGIQLYKALKSINPRMRIIFISALDAAPEITSALPGFSRKDLIPKPVDQRTLINIVSDAIIEAKRSQERASAKDICP
jgi:CheY-like chemotaxis protein/predicted transcriptional regulator